MSGFWIFILGILTGFGLMVLLAIRMSKKKKPAPHTGPSALDILVDRMTVIANNPDEPRAAKIAQKALKDIDA